MSDGIEIVSLESDGELFRQIRRELGLESFAVNLLTLRPRQRLRVHRHARQEEAYTVLEGELTVIVEGDPRVLRPGEIAAVRPETKRQLTNPSGERVVVLAIGAAGEHQSRDALAWESWEEGGEGRPPQEVPLPDDLPG